MMDRHPGFRVLITRAEGWLPSPVRGWVTRAEAGPWTQMGDVSVKAFSFPEVPGSPSPSDQT